MCKKILSVIFLAIFSLSLFGQAASEKFFMSATKKAAMDDYTAAMQDINKAISAAPKSAKLYFTRGMISYAMGNKSTADEDFKKVIAFPAPTADDLRIRAMAHTRLRDHEARDADLKAILDIEPKNAADYFARAIALVGLRKYREAAETCDSLIEKSPKFTKAYLLRGSLYDKRLNQKDDAIADYKKALELDPQNAETMVLIGEVYLEEEKFDDAAKYFEDALKIFPDTKRVQRLLEDAKAHKKRKNK